MEVLYLERDTVSLIGCWIKICLILFFYLFTESVFAFCYYFQEEVGLIPRICKVNTNSIDDDDDNDDIFKNLINKCFI